MNKRRFVLQAAVFAVLYIVVGISVLVGTMPDYETTNDQVRHVVIWGSAVMVSGVVVGCLLAGLCECVQVGIQWIFAKRRPEAKRLIELEDLDANAHQEDDFDKDLEAGTVVGGDDDESDEEGGERTSETHESTTPAASAEPIEDELR